MNVQNQKLLKLLNHSISVILVLKKKLKK